MNKATRHGVELLRDPSLNESTAFTVTEKEALGLVGLVPDVTESEDLQLQRVMMQLGHKTIFGSNIYLCRSYRQPTCLRIQVQAEHSNPEPKFHRYQALQL